MIRAQCKYLQNGAALGAHISCTKLIHCARYSSRQGDMFVALEVLEAIHQQTDHDSVTLSHTT